MKETQPTTSLGYPAAQSDQGEEAFGAVLRRFRLASGLSQEALAERARLSPETIGALERGLSQSPQRATVRLLAEALGLGVEGRTVLEAAIVRRRGARRAAPLLVSSSETTAPFVFVSYSRDDSDFATRLTADLAAHGIGGRADRAGIRPATGDMAFPLGLSDDLPYAGKERPGGSDDLPYAGKWEQVVRAAIRTCRAVLLVVSPTARQSRIVEAELAVAEMYGRPVVPVWYAGEQWLECVPPALSSVPAVDARGPRYSEAIAALVAQVGRLVDVASGAESDGARDHERFPRNPYKGLRAFAEADVRDFFGRGAAVDALLGAMEAAVMPGQATAARLLAVLGPSGSGKSSLILAGLMPRLKAGAIAGSDRWVYLDPIVPGAYPMEALMLTLAGKLDRGLHALREDLTADSARGLHLLARRLAPRPETRVVLVIDQFEELFAHTTSEEERRQFIDLVLTAVTEPRGPLLVLLALRADFYDRPLAYPALGAMLETHSKVVLPMTLAELRAAIAQPADLPDVRLTFEPGLVGDLLFEVAGQAGALPLLEFTLDQLVARRQGSTLTLAAYQEIGGVRGALTRHAETVYAALPSEEHRRLARALFLRLIDPGATEQDSTRRRALLSELTLPDTRQTALMHEVTDAFVAARLLTTGEHAGSTRLEVSHEALIREWARLADWLREAREDIRMQQTISEDAAAWAQRGRPADHLYRGSVLEEARIWAARNMPSADEQAFIDTAETAEREQDAAEQARRARELALARQAALANRRAAARLRVLAGVLALFLLVAAGLSVVALNNASVASRAGTRAAANARAALVALSRELSLQADTLMNSHRQVALLLSVEANRLNSSAATRAILFRAVYDDPRLLSYLTTQTSRVMSVAFSPRGAILASGSDDGTIRLWDVARRRPLGAPLTGHTGSVNSVAFNRAGTILASGSDDGTVRLWDVARRRPLGAPLTGQAGFVNTIAFSPNGAILAAGGTAPTIHLWDVPRRHPLGQPLSGQTGFVNSMAFSPDGAILAVGSGDGTVRLWDVVHHRPLGSSLADHAGAVHSVAFSPDGRMLAAGGSNGVIRLWDVASRQPLGTSLTGHDGLVYGIAFSPDGKVMASSGEDHTIRLWDVATRQPLGPPLTGHIGSVYSVAFSPDSKTLASGSEDGTILLWNMASAYVVSPVLAGHTDSVDSVAFSPDGKTLASGSDDNTVRLWDVATGQPLGPPLTGHTDSVMCVVFSPDGKILASGSADTTIRLWDVAHRRPLGPPLVAHSGPVYGLAFSPDGKTLMSSGDDGTIRLWDVATGQPRGPMRTGHIVYSGRHTGNVGSMAFSPDGTILASLSPDNTLQLWSVATGKPLGPFLTGHTNDVGSVAFSPDSKILATGSSSSDGMIQLWSVATGKPLGPPLTGLTGYIGIVAFSPDGTILAAGGSADDNLGGMSIRLWDVATGQPLGPSLIGHTNDIDSLAFSPDGKTLASGSDDKTIRLWPIGPHQLVAQRACAIVNRNLTLQEWRQYLGDLPYHRTCPDVP